MLIKPDKKYNKPLSDLWHEVFGDDYGYINLLFGFEFNNCDTFAKEIDGKIVSALYLLNCKIDFDNKEYKGKYLYAAATSPAYRSKGIMAELIKEAREHCQKEQMDFISLVPGNEGLYNYYEKFGFKTAMHRYETVIRNLPHNNAYNSDSMTDIPAFVIEKYQNIFNGNRFSYCEDDLQYAINCLDNAQSSFYRISKDGYFIADKEMTTVHEFISSLENFENNFQKMLNHFTGKIKIYSPYDLSEYGETKSLKYGMLFPINNELKRNWHFTDIYMNLALD